MRHVSGAAGAFACFFCGHKSAEYIAVREAARGELERKQCERIELERELERDRELERVKARIKPLGAKFAERFLRSIETDPAFAKAAVALFSEAVN